MPALPLLEQQGKEGNRRVAHAAVSPFYSANKLRILSRSSSHGAFGRTWFRFLRGLLIRFGDASRTGSARPGKWSQ